MGWAKDAALAATLGKGDHLPSIRSVAITEDSTRLRWTQSAEEIKDWTRRIRRSGSSLRAVIHADLQAYVDADGDLLAMPVVCLCLVDSGPKTAD